MWRHSAWPKNKMATLFDRIVIKNKSLGVGCLACTLILIIHFQLNLVSVAALKKV